MNKKITGFSTKIAKIEKEFKSKKWNNEKIKNYIVELEFEKSKTNSISEIIKIGTIPLFISFLSLVLSLLNLKTSYLIFLITGFTFVELIGSFCILYKCNIVLMEIDLTLELAKNSIK